MTLKEKQMLVSLLHKYMECLFRDDETNKNQMKLKWSERKSINGVKTQYEHARCICRKLELEINKSLMANVS